MTLATRITITRMLLIPVFIGFAVYYAASVHRGAPCETFHVIAVVVFAVAALSDGVDGFIARHFNQRSKLGVLLDPLADKALLLAAIVTLTVTPWRQAFPLWFPILVIGRDLVLIGGYFRLIHFTGVVEVQPHVIGKISTFLQMLAIAWVMLDIRIAPLIWPVGLSALFTVVSGILYIADGLGQFYEYRRTHPKEDAPANHG